MRRPELREVPIPCLGTTHADYFDGEVPVVRNLKQNEILNDYELNIGEKLYEGKTFQGNSLCPLKRHVLLQKHGVLTFGKDAKQSLENSIVLEEVAEMAHLTNCINSDRMVTKDQEFLFKKHYDESMELTILWARTMNLELKNFRNKKTYSSQR